MAKSIDQFIDPTEHAAIDHSGQLGVPPAETYTSVQHAADDHTGQLGVPAPEAFTSGVHAAADHSAIAGVGRAILQWHGFVGLATSIPLFNSSNYLVTIMPVAGTLETFIPLLGGGVTISFEITINGGVVSTTPILGSGTTHAINVAFAAGDLIGVRTLAGSGGSAFHSVSISVKF